MTRILDRYLLGQLLLPFVVGLLAFVVLISGHFLWQATQIIVQHRVNALAILEFVALQMPRAAVLAIPVSTLLACSLVMNRLASEGELVAISAGGVSSGRATVPLVIAALVACGLCLADSEALAPAAERHARDLLGRIAMGRKTLSFKPGAFVEAGNGVRFFTGQVDTRADTLTNLMVFVAPSQGPVMMIHAPRARFGPDGLETAPGQSYVLDPDGSFTSARDAGSRINLSGLPFGGGIGGSLMGDLSLRELRRRAVDVRARYPGEGRRYLMELHARLALAAAPLVFALLATPLTLVLGRRESLIGVLATVLFAFIYFVLMLWMRMLGDGGQLPAPIAAHLLNSIIACLALLGIWRLR